MSKISSFTDLKAWQTAHELVVMLYKETANFPRAEQYSLTDQLRRAAVSVSLNLAEGFSKASHKEKRQFYHTALASLTEVQNQMLIAKDVGYIPIDQFTKLSTHATLISKLTNGLIRGAPDRPYT